MPPNDISILVIDDDASIREILTDFLEAEGFRVRAEACGEAGLVALTNEPADVVLTDLRMPGMGGLEVVQRVKDAYPDTEVIVLTGYATIQDGVEAMRSGAYDFLLKPIRVPQIEAVLKRCGEWIRHRRSHAELQQVNRKLLELNRMKQRFLAVTDHELRTPVAVLDGMLQLLLRQAQRLPEDLRGRVESLSQVAGRLAGLVRDIHDVVRSQKQELQIHPVETTAAVLARSIELDFQMVRFDRDLQLDLDSRVPPEHLLNIDPKRLSQAITELIQNAVKATPDGGRVTVCLALEAAEDGDVLRVTVTDTGVGIPPAQRDQVFQALHAVGDEMSHHTSKTDFGGGGLGLGLSIALEIVRAHGGGLDVESEPGRGTTFTARVSLPS